MPRRLGSGRRPRPINVGQNDATANPNTLSQPIVQTGPIAIAASSRAALHATPSRMNILLPPSRRTTDAAANLPNSIVTEKAIIPPAPANLPAEVVLSMNCGSHCMGPISPRPRNSMDPNRSRNPACFSSVRVLRRVEPSCECLGNFSRRELPQQTAGGR